MKRLRFFSLLSLLALASYANVEAGRYTSELQKTGRLGISTAECSGMEAKLGQLLYANVDNFGSMEKDALDPAYIKMVEDLQLGGVLPKTALAKQNKVAEAYLSDATPREPAGKDQSWKSELTKGDQ